MCILKALFQFFTRCCERTLLYMTDASSQEARVCLPLLLNGERDVQWSPLGSYFALRHFKRRFGVILDRAVHVTKKASATGPNIYNNLRTPLTEYIVCYSDFGD